MEGELQRTVGANLRRFRRHLGCSQESFGELVGWHRTFVGAVERGERNLTMRTIERLAAQLGIDPPMLLVDSDALPRAWAGEVGPSPMSEAADGADGRPAGAPGARRARPSPTQEQR